MKLDVGCGCEPVGDVNVDVCRFGSVSRSSLEVVPVCSNFVLCDAQFLPFKSKVFNEVVCRQVIEHLQNPFMLMKELVRVCCGKLVVETVHRFGERLHSLFSGERVRWRKVNHVSVFNGRWFSNVAEVLCVRFVRSYVVNYEHFPNSIFQLLTMPYEVGYVFYCW